MKDSNFSPLSVYIPTLDACITITGACLEDGKARLIWKTDDNRIGTMDIGTFQMLAKLFAIPY